VPHLIIPIILILVGVLLIVAEVYLVPGFNIVGILGALMILFAIGYAFTETGFLGGVAALVGAILLVGAVLYGMKQSGAWDRFVLSTNLKRDEMTVARESEQRARYLGKTGVALSPLRPTGIVEIDGERIEVATEGDFIAAGSHIKVVAMDRRRYFVRLDASEESEAVA
jgi:membrane-bound serine protease (ClpP class)